MTLSSRLPSFIRPFFEFDYLFARSVIGYFVETTALFFALFIVNVYFVVVLADFDKLTDHLIMSYFIYMIVVSLLLCICIAFSVVVYNTRKQTLYLTLKVALLTLILLLETGLCLFLFRAIYMQRTIEARISENIKIHTENGTADSVQLIDRLQSSYQCCGLHSYTEWPDTDKLPISCCKPQESFKVTAVTNNKSIEQQRPAAAAAVYVRTSEKELKNQFKQEQQCTEENVYLKGCGSPFLEHLHLGFTISLAMVIATNITLMIELCTLIAFEGILKRHNILK